MASKNEGAPADQAAARPFEQWAEEWLAEKKVEGLYKKHGPRG